MDRRGTIALAVFTILLTATIVPPLGRFLPIATGATGSDGHGPPASDITPLPEFTATQIVEIVYTAYIHGRHNGGGGGSNGSDDVDTEGLSGSMVSVRAVDCSPAKDWTELFYRTASDAPWALYAPPWNACGHWIGSPGAGGTVSGTIPFDSLFTGGEGPYQFVTIAVHRGQREPMPDAAKALTTVDYHAPTLFIGSPVADAWTNRDLLQWNATDAISGIAAVNLSVDGSSPISLGSASGSKPLGITEGTHAILVTATDRAGNRADARVPFHFDPTAPSLAFTAPARDAFVRTTDVVIAWTAVSQGAPLTNLRLTIDTAPPVELATNATSYRVVGLPERGHLLTLLAIDAAGNLATDSLTFGVDATPPTVAIVEPGPFVNSRDLRIYWVGFDSASGIDRFEVALDEGAAVSLPDVSGYEFPLIPEGTHSVAVRAYDRAGNVEDATASVTVDRTPPTVSVTEPEPGAAVSGNVEVAWTMSDDRSGIDPNQTYFVYDNVAALAAGTTKAAVSAPTLGPHFALVRVRDRAGNAAEDGVAFTYGGSNPTSPLGISALDFSLLILVLFAIAVVAAYVAVRRRQRRRAP